ncbi:MAG: hypothetical protein P8075_14700 [Deltaproteobacteria bacterium]
MEKEVRSQRSEVGRQKTKDRGQKDAFNVFNDFNDFNGFNGFNDFNDLNGLNN